MVSIIRATPGAIVVQVLRRLNDSVEEFTATAGAAGTITAPAPLSTTADFYKNNFIYLYEGTSAGDERLITAYSAGRVATVEGNFTATPTTSTKAVITSGVRPKHVYDAVVEAIRRAAYYFPRPLTDTSLRVGNILNNGHFEFWDNASAVAVPTFIYTGKGGSDGWSVQGNASTGTRESTISNNRGPFSRYSVKLISDGTNAAEMRHIVPNWAEFAGKKLTVIGYAYASAASRINLSIDDGVTLTTSSSHTGTAGWEELSKEVTIAAAATQLWVRCSITLGSAQTAYFDDIRLYEKSLVYRIARIPPWFGAVERVYQETGTAGVYADEAFRLDDYRYLPNSDGWDTIRFDASPSQSLVADRRLMLEGTGLRTDIIAVTTNIEYSPQLIADMAVEELDRADTPARAQALKSATARVDRFFARAGIQRVEAGHSV